MFCIFFETSNTSSRFFSIFVALSIASVVRKVRWHIYGRRLHTLVRIGLSNSQLEKILTYDNKHRVAPLWVCNLEVAAFIALSNYFIHIRRGSAIARSLGEGNCET